MYNNDILIVPQILPVYDNNNRSLPHSFLLTTELNIVHVILIRYFSLYYFYIERQILKTHETSRLSPTILLVIIFYPKLLKKKRCKLNYPTKGRLSGSLPSCKI